MTEDQAKLFNYKGRDIIVRAKAGKYQIGIRGRNGIDMWFEKFAYDTLNLAITSGREYARIVIDNMILSHRKEYKPL
jgi:hypothetical protein